MTDDEATATCRRCGHPRPDNIDHIWACCGDGPGYAGHIKPEVLACRERELATAKQQALEAKKAGKRS